MNVCGSLISWRARLLNINMRDLRDLQHFMWHSSRDEIYYLARLNVFEFHVAQTLRISLKHFYGFQLSRMEILKLGKYSNKDYKKMVLVWRFPQKVIKKLDR